MTKFALFQANYVFPVISCIRMYNIDACVTCVVFCKSALVSCSKLQTNAKFPACSTSHYVYPLDYLRCLCTFVYRTEIYTRTEVGSDEIAMLMEAGGNQFCGLLWAYWTHIRTYVEAMKYL